MINKERVIKGLTFCTTINKANQRTARGGEVG